MKPNKERVAEPSPVDSIVEEIRTLQGGLLLKQSETWLRQGQLLLQARDLIPYGSWMKWMEANLPFTPRHADRLMVIGSLQRLPKMEGIQTDFLLHDLESIAGTVARDDADVDEVAKWYYGKRKTDRAANESNQDQEEPKKKRGKKTADVHDIKQAAYLVIGIDFTSRSVTDETLDIIHKGLMQRRHPDKGGSDEAFVALTKAMEVITGTKQ